MALGTVRIVDHDPAWAARFEAERALLAQVMAGAFVALEHIGSTAVPGLAAKPIIDIMAGARSLQEVEERAGALARAGYEHRPDAFAGDRIFFRKYTGGERSHHLHVVPVSTLTERNELLFRDYLRAHPAAAAEYERTKRSLAERFRHDRARYIEGKTSCIQAVVDAARDGLGIPRIPVWEP